MMRAQRRREERDSGFTLIELMVTAAISLIVITIAGGLVASNARVNTTVQTTTRTTGTGQVIAQSFTQAVLNADWASTPTTGTKQFFTVHTVGRATTATWYCQAWYFDGTTGSMYTKTSSSAITAPTGAPTGWTLLGSGLSAVGSTPVLSGSGSGISLSMNVKNTGSNAVLISTTITKRQTATGATSCQ